MLVGVQLNITWEDPPANFAAVRRLLDESNVAPGSLVVLPEMFNTGFSLDADRAAESWDGGPTQQFLSELAGDIGVYVVGGLAVRVAPDRCENQAAVIGRDGQAICRYGKMHPFRFAGEDAAYTAGDQIQLFEWGEFTVAPFVCYDLRFPEIFRIATKRGASVFTIGANWPQPREAHWIALLQARAIENQAYVVGINRCGSDPSHVYSGRSLIVNPNGDVIADAGNDEGVIRAEADLDILCDIRGRFPFLQDMRDDCLPPVS